MVVGALARIGSRVASRGRAVITNNPGTSGLLAGLALDDLPVVGGLFGGGGSSDDGSDVAVVAVIAAGLAFGAAWLLED